MSDDKAFNYQNAFKSSYISKMISQDAKKACCKIKINTSVVFINTCVNKNVNLLSLHSFCSLPRSGIRVLVLSVVYKYLLPTRHQWALFAWEYTPSYTNANEEIKVLNQLLYSSARESKIERIQNTASVVILVKMGHVRLLSQTRILACLPQVVWQLSFSRNLGRC